MPRSPPGLCCPPGCYILVEAANAENVFDLPFTEPAPRLRKCRLHDYEDHEGPNGVWSCPYCRFQKSGGSLEAPAGGGGLKGEDPMKDPDPCREIDERLDMIPRCLWCGRIKKSGECPKCDKEDDHEE